MDIPNFVIVCAHCIEQSSQKDGVLVEYNFKDQMVYTICPKCKKKNEMGVRMNTALSLPRAKLAR
jgi:hypothetical protein